MRALLLVPVALCCLVPFDAAAAEGPPPTQSIGEREGPPLPETTPSVPVRERRRWALAGELGFNGLAGVGLVATHHTTRHLSFDLGAGMAVGGLKLGARGRYRFWDSRSKPFVGAGFLFTTGTGDDDVEIELHGEERRIRILPSPFLQAVTGFEFAGERGFTFTAAVGRAQLLRERNVVLVSGPPIARKEREAMFGSGPVVSVAVGRSF